LDISDSALCLLLEEPIDGRADAHATAEVPLAEKSLHLSRPADVGRDALRLRATLPPRLLARSPDTTHDVLLHERFQIVSYRDNILVLKYLVPRTIGTKRD
jgi:hypothetical protein